MRYRFCPLCATPLFPRQDGLMKCPSGDCRFTDYETPISASACLVPHNNGIVLVQRGVNPFKGSWCLPCGFVKKGEDPQGACIRETFEETGLNVELEKILYICNPSTWGDETNQIIFHFLGKVTDGTLKADDDAMEVAVFTEASLPEICFESHKKVIDAWFDYARVR